MLDSTLGLGLLSLFGFFQRSRGDGLPLGFLSSFGSCELTFGFENRGSLTLKN
jgi:hypothetical protein